MKNPEGFTKEQIKQINKDVKKQKREVEIADFYKELKEKSDELIKRAKEKEQMSELDRMFGTKVTTLPFNKTFSVLKKKNDKK